VPQQAVTHNQKGEPTAMVVGADNKVELRSLKTERAIGASWLVSDGLKAGDRVIVQGLQQAKAGRPGHGARRCRWRISMRATPKTEPPQKAAQR
jgi:membrane fusion protein (multidrug efflux system)